MSLVGIFSKARPSIGGLFFDALLEESSELITDATEYPIEDGRVGNDHAVTRPLRLTMTVALSDNPFKSAQAAASEYGALAGSAIGGLVGMGVGAAIGHLGGAAASAVGLAGSVANGLFNPPGSAETRSATMLENIRNLQKAAEPFYVVGAKGAWGNMLITNTRTQITKQNEGGLELVVEMRQMIIVGRMSGGIYEQIRAENLPAGDTAATQAQPEVNIGEVALQ